MNKKLILTIGLLIQLAVVVVGQNKTFAPPKNTNLIIIQKKDTALHFLMDYAKQLQDFGFSIDKMDKELLSLSTDFKSYKLGGIAVLKITTFSRQNGDSTKLEIRGKIEITNPNGGQVPFEACNCGMSGDAQKNAFKEILKTLTNFSFETIQFLKK